jgi:RNA polymerase sigma-B factor
MTAELLQRAGDAGPDQRAELLDEVVVANMRVANAVAARYQGRGIDAEDLRQVAYVALVRAAEGFDPQSGNDFLAYAVPTIRGEIKRYFRDNGWMVRPPRRVQELQARISLAQSELAFKLGRPPRTAELAEHLGESEDAIIEALTSDGCFTPASLDRPVGDEDGTASLGDVLGCEDRGRDAAEARILLGPLVRRLEERDRRILMLRFFRGWTQQEIAEDVGVTQMQVSRLLSRILSELRDELDEPEAPTKQPRAG